MVEISTEQSMLITVVTFLGVFALLVGMIPQGFLTSSPEYKKINVPEYFESIDIQYYANTHNFTLSPSTFEYRFTLGGWNIEFEYWSQRGFSARTYDSWWVFNWNFDNFRWYDIKGIERSYYYSIAVQDRLICNLSIIDKLYIENGENGLKWELKNDHTQLTLYFGFNQTAFSKPSDAFNSGQLHVLFCIQFDKVNTSFNAWNLVSALLFFQMPNVHPIINMLIAIPVWVAIAYLIYILIIKVIPFVG